MENEHYKRNDSILYLLVVLSICLSVVSIVMQFNLRSKASQAARLNLTPVNEGQINVPIPTSMGTCDELKGYILHLERTLQEYVQNNSGEEAISEVQAELRRARAVYAGSCLA
ncbi:MAG: hypothetical protein IT410_04555 [Candidatus Doudnabacteria bacterium]|nr:hypothetical protein [Candidatus Doudnabacteria bacterium]